MVFKCYFCGFLMNFLDFGLFLNYYIVNDFIVWNVRLKPLLVPKKGMIENYE